MAVEVASLKATLDLDKKGLDTGLKDARGGLSGLVGGLGGAAAGFATLAVGVTAAAGALTGAVSVVSDWVQSARESTQVNKQLEAVIASTGGVAGVTADAARDLATALSMVTNFEDDAIIRGENLLLTFTRIGSDIFPRATEAMLDMSQALGQDLKASAIQLGKALNDPIKGMTALQRVGVTFSAQQKQQIKDFQQAGQLAQAQGVILDELAREFGGSARALADPFIMLQNSLGEVGEALGGPILSLLTQYITFLLPGIRAAAEGLGNALATVGPQIAETLGPALAEAAPVIVEMVHAFGRLLSSIRAVAVSLGLASEETSGLQIVLAPLLFMIRASTAFWTAMATVVNVVASVLGAIATVVNGVRSAWSNMTSSVREAMAAGSGIVSVWNGLIAAGQTLWRWINNIIIGWQRLISVMSQQIAIDPIVRPGSPTPLELGLKGINRELAIIGPRMAGFVGNIPTSSGASVVNNNATVNIGGISATSQTMGDPATEAIRMTIKELKRQLGK